MITDRDCEAVHHLVHHCSAGDRFKEALRGSRRGRKREWDASLWLIGLLLTVHTYQRSHTRKMHQVLTQDVPLDWQYRWGIRKSRPPRRGQPQPDWVLSEDDLQNVTRLITKRLDYSRRRFTAWLKGDLEEERQRRYRVLNSVVDALLKATLPDRPEGARMYALDGTGLWASERSGGSLPKEDIVEGNEEDAPAPTQAEIEEIASSLGATWKPGDVMERPTVKDVQPEEAAARRLREPAPVGESTPQADAPGPQRIPKGGFSDAAFGVKTKKDGTREWYFGYEAHAIVRVPDDPKAGGVRPEPALAERIRVTPAGTDVIEPSFDMIDSILAEGQAITYLMADRHYSFKLISRWLFQLIRRGIEHVVDLRVDDQGFVMWEGTLIAAGWPHCPATPSELGDIRKPDVDKGTKKEWRVFFDKIKRRFQYAAERTAPLKADGKSRWGCPAFCGKLGCLLIPGSVEAARAAGLEIVQNPPSPDNAPRICTQSTIGLHITTDAQAKAMKVNQKFYWGSEKQQGLYNRRTYVEGWFGILKGDSAANKKRGSNLYRGLPLVTLEVAAFSVTANLIALRKWHQETGLGDKQSPLLRDGVDFLGHLEITQDEWDAIRTMRRDAA